MPRELRPELEALINSGHCNWQTTLDITLTSGTPLHLSSCETFIDRFGVTRQYLARLVSDKIRPLDISMDIETDGMEVAVTNADPAFGQQFTGAERELDGATAIRGVMFIDRDLPFEDGQHILDLNFPGELIAGEVGEEEVNFELVSEIDSVIVAGRTIAEEFQWREPVSAQPIDILPPWPGPNPNPEPGPGPRYGGGGRWGDIEPIGPWITPVGGGVT